MSLADAGFVLSPVAGSHVDAGAEWSLPSLTMSGTWGRRAARGSSTFQLARQSAARERALLALRRRARPRVAGVHRLDPPALRLPAARRLASRVLRGGVLVELRDHGTPSRLDAIMSASGWSVEGAVRIGSGGGISAVVRRGNGRGVLRAGRAGTAGDPVTDATALRALAPSSVPAPTLLEADEFDGVSWSIASFVEGSTPPILRPMVRRTIADALANMPPASDEPGNATVEDLRVLRLALTEAGATTRDLLDALSQLERRASVLSGRCAQVARHGDLWTGNVITRGDHVAAFVDWDAYHPAANAGADFLQLVATERRLERRMSLGEVWHTEPWLEPDVGAHLRASNGDLEAARLAWWASEAANSVRRDRELAADQRWVAINVEAVVASIGRGGLSSAS